MVGRIWAKVVSTPIIQNVKLKKAVTYTHYKSV